MNINNIENIHGSTRLMPESTNNQKDAIEDERDKLLIQPIVRRIEIKFCLSKFDPV